MVRHDLHRTERARMTSTRPRPVACSQQLRPTILLAWVSPDHVDKVTTPGATGKAPKRFPGRELSDDNPATNSPEPRTFARPHYFGPGTRQVGFALRARRLAYILCRKRLS